MSDYDWNSNYKSSDTPSKRRGSFDASPRRPTSNRSGKPPIRRNSGDISPRREGNDNKKKSGSFVTSQSSFDEGDVIEARYKNGNKWFKGKISRVHSDGTYDVEYDDGDREKYIPSANIRLASNSMKEKDEKFKNKMREFFQNIVSRGEHKTFFQKFETYDINASGKISNREFRKAIRNLDLDLDLYDN